MKLLLQEIQDLQAIEDVLHILKAHAKCCLPVILDKFKQIERHDYASAN